MAKSLIYPKVRDRIAYRDLCPQARLQEGDVRRLMRISKAFPGNKLVLWEPRRGVHIHRIIKTIVKDYYFISVTFEDGGSKSWANNQKLLIDR